MHPAIFNRARVYGAKLIRDLPRREDIYLGVASSKHAMAIAGLDSAKPDSDPIKYRVVNSWGPDIGDHGIYHMYAEWFEENVFKLAVHESVLDDRDRAGVRRIRSRCPAATSTESRRVAGLRASPGRASRPGDSQIVAIVSSRSSSSPASSSRLLLGGGGASDPRWDWTRTTSDECEHGSEDAIADDECAG